jgi:hypothetical protein
MKFFSSHKKAAVAGLALTVAIVGGGVAFAYWTSSGSGTGAASDATATALTITQDGTPIYNSTVSPLPGSMASQAFQATQTSQFGNEVNLVSSTAPLSNVVVTMEDWACQNWASGASPCVTTPGSSFNYPITLTIYNDAGNGVVGSVIGTDTQNFNIPFRPSDNATCTTSGEWLDNAATAAQFNVAADGLCHHGLANNITFNFSSQGLVLPSTVIYGISFNTQSYGQAPTGVNGPYNSLNVGLTTDDVNPSIGSDTNTGKLDMNTALAGNYCDNGAGGVGGFRLDSPAPSNPAACVSSNGGWSVAGSGHGAPYYLPAVEFNVGTASGLYPGGPAQPINFSVTNPGSIPEALNTVTIAISTITHQHATSGGACDPGWFTITQPTVINGSVAAGSTWDDTSSGASIQLNNSTTINEDACQGATVNLTFTSN